MAGIMDRAYAATTSENRNAPAAFGGGAIIGALGGLIGLGGAEFRLPLLIGVFRFTAVEAVILNKAMSLIVVASAFPFRAGAVPLPRTGRSSSTCWREACSARGSAQAGPPGFGRKRSIGLSPSCWG
jgi:hypothetical protein